MTKKEEKTVAQLELEVATLTEKNDYLQLFKDTLSFQNSVYEQKINYLEKHYPDLVKSARWDLDESKRVQAFESTSLYDLKILN